MSESHYASFARTQANLIFNNPNFSPTAVKAKLTHKATQKQNPADCFARFGEPATWASHVLQDFQVKSQVTTISETHCNLFYNTQSCGESSTVSQIYFATLETISRWM